MLTNSIRELKELNSTLRDEHTALHLLYCSLEEKLRKTQTENGQLVERLMKFKAKDAEKMNEDNETFLRWANFSFHVLRKFLPPSILLSLFLSD